MGRKAIAGTADVWGNLYGVLMHGVKGERLKNALDSAFFNQDLRRSVANSVIAAPNWRFGARASA